MIRGTPGLNLPLSDRQDVAAACLCRRCAGEMYVREVAYLWQDRRICPDCCKAEIAAWLEEAPQEVACALGVEREMV